MARLAAQLKSNNIMKQLTNLLAATALLTACVTTASAATSGPFTTSTPIPSTLTDWSGTILFPQFNSGLGTLTSVELDLSAAFTTTLTVSNNSLSASSGTVKTEVQLTVQDGGLNLTAPELDLVGPIFSYSLSAGDGVTSGLLSKSGSSSDVYTSAPVLTEFTGFGNISLSASTFTQTLLANTGGNTAASQITDASLTGDVIYTYSEVPEPSTFALIGLGLAALPMFRRKRQ